MVGGSGGSTPTSSSSSSSSSTTYMYTLVLCTMIAVLLCTSKYPHTSYCYLIIAGRSTYYYYNIFNSYIVV